VGPIIRLYQLFEFRPEMLRPIWLGYALAARAAERGKHDLIEAAEPQRSTAVPHLSVRRSIRNRV